MATKLAHKNAIVGDLHRIRIRIEKSILGFKKKGQNYNYAVECCLHTSDFSNPSHIVHALDSVRESIKVSDTINVEQEKEIFRIKEALVPDVNEVVKDIEKRKGAGKPTEYGPSSFKRTNQDFEEIFNRIFENIKK